MSIQKSIKISRDKCHLVRKKESKQNPILKFATQTSDIEKQIVKRASKNLLLFTLSLSLSLQLSLIL